MDDINNNWDVQLLVQGEPASKANSRKVVRYGGISRLIKSDKARAYEKTFKSQVRPLPEMIEGDVEIQIEVWYASRRPDLDESLILDLLQGVVYLNDRQVKIKHIYWNLDPDSPRVLIKVKKIPELVGDNSITQGGRRQKKSTTNALG
jgi:Holliday junction resolvase RusA-like endonuclease